MSKVRSGLKLVVYNFKNMRSVLSSTFENKRSDIHWRHACSLCLLCFGAVVLQGGWGGLQGHYGTSSDSPSVEVGLLVFRNYAVGLSVCGTVLISCVYRRLQQLLFLDCDSHVVAQKGKSHCVVTESHPFFWEKNSMPHSYNYCGNLEY